MPLTTKQLKLYSDAGRRAYLAWVSRQEPGQPVPSESDWRRAQAVAVLGRRLTAADSNTDLDNVLDHFEGIEKEDEFDPAAMAGPTRQIKRLAAVVRRLMDEYAATWDYERDGRSAAMTIMRERFQVLFIEELEACEYDTLKQMADTFTNRVRQRRRAAGGDGENQ